jgi:dipeptidyl aminopeptidase/acylaminoacyl peptidase
MQPNFSAWVQSTPMRAIPVSWCVGGRDLSEPRLRPDGSAIAWAVSEQGDTSIVLASLDDTPPDPRDPSTTRLTWGPAPRVGRGLGGGCWCWVGPDAIVYAAVDGNLWWQPLADEAARRLTDHGPERVAQAPCATPDGRGVVYVVDQSEVWHVDVATGGDGTPARRLDDGSADFCFDPQVMPCSRGAVWLAWNVPDMPWDRARVVRAVFAGEGQAAAVLDQWEPPKSVQQPRFLPDGRGICVRDDSGWNNVWLGDQPLVDEPFEHAGPTWGLGQRSFAVDDTGERVAFTRNERGFGRLCVLHLSTGRIEVIGRGVHGQLDWVGDTLSAVRTGARTPTEIVVHRVGCDDTQLVRRRIAVGPREAWSPELLVEPELVEVTTSDGAVVHARRYAADRAAGDPGRLLCWLHGGPTDQWQVTFMPRIAYWRAAGWDVLVPDHRGSTGHGRDYQQALRGRWGELDVADTVAVLDHAHASGWSTPATTALMGGSAGGFTVLGVLAAEPGVVAAAVVAYPVGDLADLAEHSHRFERHYTTSLVGRKGSLAEVDQALHHRSPVWFAHRITTPLLVFHGADDPVVPVAHSTVLAERIRTGGGDVELCVYPDEGHGFRQTDHQLDEYARTAAFLRRHVP